MLATTTAGGVEAAAAAGVETMGADEEPPPRDSEFEAAWMSGALGPVVDGAGGGGGGEGVTACAGGGAVTGVATIGADEDPPRDIEFDAAWISGALGPVVDDTGVGVIDAAVATEGVGDDTATGCTG